MVRTSYGPSPTSSAPPPEDLVAGLWGLGRAPRLELERLGRPGQIIGGLAAGLPSGLLQLVGQGLELLAPGHHLHHALQAEVLLGVVPEDLPPAQDHVVVA